MKSRVYAAAVVLVLGASAAIGGFSYCPNGDPAQGPDPFPVYENLGWNNWYWHFDPGETWLTEDIHLTVPQATMGGFAINLWDTNWYGNGPGGSATVTFRSMPSFDGAPEGVVLYQTTVSYGAGFFGTLYVATPDVSLPQNVWVDFQLPLGDSLLMANSATVGLTHDLMLLNGSQYSMGGNPPANFGFAVYGVPAPAAVLLGAIGLGLVGWVKRRLA